MLIKGNRITLKSVDKNSLDFVCGIEADQKLRRYNEVETDKLKISKKFTGRMSDDSAHDFVVCLNEMPIGLVYIWSYIDERSSWEIGYVMLPVHQGQGFCTEALKLLLKFAFDELKAHKVVAMCNEHNTSSYMLIERVGMIREGIFREELRWNQRWVNQFFYWQPPKTQVEPIFAVEKAWIYGFLRRENRVKLGFRRLPIVSLKANIKIVYVNRRKVRFYNKFNCKKEELAMIELPEANVLAHQMKETLVGKTIQNAVANNSPHGFAFYWDDPIHYGAMLNGRKITGTAVYGGLPEIFAEEMSISFCDGVNVRYFAADGKLPLKHQLLLEFDDGSAICCTIQMYGGMLAFPTGKRDDFYYKVAIEKPSPLSDEFDAAYFESLFSEDAKPTMSVKAFLATKQRIPGLGNGVLQDILFHARIHPKRKLKTLGDSDREAIFQSVKSTLKAMTEGGGRDTEKDLFGHQGGYQSILSKNTLREPCYGCGGALTRQAFLGGNIYFCGTCQPLN